MAKSKITLGGGEALLAAAFLFALTNVLVREMAVMFGNQAQIAARFALVWLILALYARLRGVRTSIPRAKLPMAIAYSALAAVSILFFTLSVQKTTIANTLFTSSATELIGAFIIGSLLLKEAVTGRKLLAICLALAGLALYSDALFMGNAGLIYGLLAGATTAFCNLLAKKLKGVNLNAIVRMQFGFGTLFMVGLTALFSASDIIRTVNPESIAALIIFALILIFATRLVLYGFQHFDINIASVVLSSQLVFGAILGYFIYHEVPASHEMISGVLIAGAAVIGSIGHRPTPRDIEVHS